MDLSLHWFRSGVSHEDHYIKSKCCDSLGCRVLNPELQENKIFCSRFKIECTQ